MIKPKAIFFDLDGTLVDSVPDLSIAIDNMLDALSLPRAGEVRVRLWVGNGARKLVQRSLAFAYHLPENDVDKALVEKAHPLFLQYYALTHTQHTCLYPDVKDVLSALVNAGIRLAIITNKPQQFTPTLLQDMQIAHFFDCVVSGDSLSEQKPSPLPLYYVQQQFKLQKDECLMVGDSANDIMAAKAAGIKSVCVSYGYNHGNDSRLLPADVHIDGIKQLLNILH